MKTLQIHPQDILHQIKMTCQLPDIVEGILTRTVITAAARSAGLDVTTTELQQAADQIRLVNQLQRADETMAWLERHGLSVDEFEELAQTQILSTKLAVHLFDHQVERYFSENRLHYTQAILYEVLFENLDLALEMFYALQEGEITFFQVAYDHCADLSQRRLGGYRGPVRRQDLKPEISSAVFAAQPPQILKPIVTSQGVHLIKVEAIEQPELEAPLHGQILSELFLAWVEDQVAHYSAVFALGNNATSTS
jgi:parvulin-like peptidyl-prolyl isomerase